MAVDTLTREEIVRTVFGSESRFVGESAHRAVVAAVSDSGESAAEVLNGLSGVSGLTTDGETLVRLSESPIFAIVVAVTLLLYIVWIVKYIAHLSSGDYAEKRWVYGDKQTRSGSSLAIDPIDTIFNLTLLIGLMTLSFGCCVDVAANYEFAKFGDAGEVIVQLIGRARETSFDRVLAGVAIYVVISSVWFGVVMWTVNLLVKSNEWGRLMLRLKAQIMRPIMLFYMPMVVMWAIWNEIEWLSYVVVVEGVIIILIFVIRSFLLFVCKKISILQWFLYLCTVEILPVTLAWAIFVRSVSII